MSDEKRYDELDAYLKGNMSATDKVQFEARLQVDSVLNHELHLLKSSREIIEFDYMKDLKANLENLAIEHKQTQNKKWWFFGGMAGLFIIAGAGFFFFPVQNQSTQLVNVELQNKQIDKAVEVKKINDKHHESLVHTQDQPIVQHSDNHVNLAPIKTSQVQRNEDVESNVTSSVVAEEIEELEISEVAQEVRQQGAKEEPVIERREVTVAPDSCIRPKVSILSYGASADADNGSIVINNESEQELIYRLSEIDDEFVQFNEFQDLESGKYTLVGKNELECEFELGEVTITRLPCLKERDQAFNKNYDQEWAIPIGQETNDGSIQIIGQRGIRLFESDFQNGEQLFWNGVDMQGAELTLGVYKVIISYNDGKTCLYNVVIEE